MLRTSARRLGVLALALAIGSLGLAAPAHAADTGSIAGQLTDGGQPAAGVRVTATALESPAWGFATTDSIGHYTLPDLPTGIYRVTFEAPGRQTQYAPGTVAANDASTYFVHAGGQVTIDGALLPLGTITGMLRDGAGSAVAGVMVSAGPAGSGDGVNAQTDQDGRYTLQVSAGVYTVSFQVAPDRTQYAPGAVDHQSAGRYTVVGGQAVTVDETVLATGAIAGRFTDRAGAGLAGVDVTASSMTADRWFFTVTDAAGDYRFDDLLPADYRVEFSDWNTNITQYVPGKTERLDATPVTVTGGGTTRVDETQLATGSVRFTVTDSVTGAPVPVFYVALGNASAEGADGTATAAGIGVGRQRYSIYAGGYRNLEAGRVTVTENGTVEVAVVLERIAKIATTVVDARTGAPVENFCVEAIVPTELGIGMGCTPSDSEGKVLIDWLRPGAYQLFAYGQPHAETASPYGAQWVTADGGTGTQPLAAIVTAVAGETVTGPTIKLDRKGAVTGTVRTSDGSPAKNAYVGFGNGDYQMGGGVMSIPVASDGAYRVDFLGPYLWPLHFYADGHAPQWSGNSGGRSGATKIKVRGDRAVTYDIQLLKGTKVTVNAPDSGYFVAYHAATGETSGVCNGRWVMTCDMLVLGGQKVRFKIWGEREHFWYGGADFATATSVSIPSTGTLTVNVTR